MNKKYESHKQALRQVLDRHGITALRQEREQLVDRERLIDEILGVNNRFNRFNGAPNSNDGSFKP